MITNLFASKSVFPAIVECSDFMDIVGAILTALMVLLVVFFILIAVVVIFTLGIVGVGVYYNHFSSRGGKTDDSR